jgi:UDP-N-acetylmuramyl tripeptide synthase
MKRLKIILKNVEATKKIGIISGVGDRRDNDIRECGKIAGRMFDHIIIRNENTFVEEQKKKLTD